VIGDGEFGWGDTEPSQAFGGFGSAVLVMASGVYCGALWLASGLQPLPYLASRVRGCVRESLLPLSEANPIR
jgi:hypothetical protein